MSDANKAVFLSYASQDTEAAKRIADALRAAGVEVWFDQSELRGGDAWDAQIRRQIKECALFVPIISANTQARGEGYFRLEWKLAVDRSHLMAEDTAFLFPIIIDDVPNAAARVPDKFREVQWTRLRLDETPSELAGRVAKLLRHEGEPERREETAPSAKPRRRERRPTWVRTAWTIVGLLFAVLYLLKPMWRQPREKETPPVAPAASAPSPVGPSEARRLAAKAQQLFLMLDSGRDDFVLAEEMLKQAVAKAPDDAEVWATYAYLHERYAARGWDPAHERRELARVAIQRALRLDPTSYEARFAAASLFTGSNVKDNREREQALRALLKERPDDKRLIRELAATLRNLPGHEEEILELYDRATALPGGDPLALYSKSLALWFMGRVKEANATVTAAVAQEPFTSARLLAAYLSLVVEGDLDRAKRLLEELPYSTLQDDRGCFFGYLVYAYRGEPDQALALLHSFPRDWINDSWFHGPKGLLVGNALAFAGRQDAAAIEWRAALKLVDARLADAPNNLDLLGTRLTLLAKLGDFAAARPLYSAVRQMLPATNGGGSDAPWYFHACVALGERAEALRIIGRSLESKRHAVLFPAADLRYNPEWKSLRDDPEFARLLAEAERLEREDAAPSVPSPSSLLPAPSNPPLADSKSVAVLAFANLSDDKANEYFSDGISEELLNVLAKIPNLKVTARTSSFYFKGKEVPVPEIARQLGVAYVVEGSVRKSGGKVRITAQLIKAADGFHVWSDTFTRDLKDVFAVQDEIAGLIAKQLSLKLDAPSVNATATINPEAYELYVQARQAWNLRNEEGFARAEQLLNRVLELAPDFARAHAALADVWTLQLQNRAINSTFQHPHLPEQDRIAAQIHRALELDPESAEAHAALGNLVGNQWDLVQCEAEYRRAIALNPNYASAHQWLGYLLVQLGRMEEGVSELKVAAELDPLSSRVADNYGYGLYLAGRYATALRVTEHALALQPNNWQAQGQKAAILARLGRGPEAVSAVDLLPADVPYAVSFQIWVLCMVGRVAEGAALLARQKPDSFRSMVLMALGQPDEAIAQFDQNSLVVVANIVAPDFDPIREDPRFLKKLAAVNMTAINDRIKDWRATHPPETGK